MLPLIAEVNIEYDAIYQQHDQNALAANAWLLMQYLYHEDEDMEVIP